MCLTLFPFFTSPLLLGYETCELVQDDYQFQIEVT